MTRLFVFSTFSKIEVGLTATIPANKEQMGIIQSSLFLRGQKTGTTASKDEQMMSDLRCKARVVPIITNS